MYQYACDPRAIRVRAVLFQVVLGHLVARVVAQESLELLDRNLLGRNQEAAGNLRSGRRLLARRSARDPICGAPITNSTGPLMSAKLCPWPLTHHLRVPCSLSCRSSCVDRLELFLLQSSIAAGSTRPHCEYRRRDRCGRDRPVRPSSRSRSSSGSCSAAYVPSARISARRFEMSPDRTAPPASSLGGPAHEPFIRSNSGDKPRYQHPAVSAS